MPPDLVRLVADEPKGPVCLYRLSVGVSVMCYHTWLYMWVLGIWIQVLMLTFQVLTNGAIAVVMNS